MSRALRWGIGTWVALFSTLLLGDAADADARSRRRRQREQNECRASTPISREEQERAERHYDSGVIYFDTQDYARAKQDFEQAYEISKAPDFLVNLAIVQTKLKNYAEAIRHLEAYIAECPNAPDVPAAKLKLDDLRIAQAIQEGEKQAEPKVRLPPVGAMALLGTGAGLLLVGVGLGGGALSVARSVSDPAKQGQPWDPAVESKGRALDTAGLVLDTLGLVAMAAGGVWTGVYYYQRQHSLTLTLRPATGGLLMLGRF
jgi:tetratricopeptide (TPR) repeat protein